MDLKTWGYSDSNVNSDVIIRLDSGGDPSIDSNAGKITYNINGPDRHIMTSTGLYIVLVIICCCGCGGGRLFSVDDCDE